MRVKNFLMTSICISAIFLSGCEAVNSGLGAVNEALSGVNNSIGNSSEGAVYVPDSVRQATLSAFTDAQRSEIQSLINDAKPTITEMVGKAACGASSRIMGRYTDPDSVTNMYVSPMISMSYHKSGCVNPIRIHGWERLASNALRFTVDYMSPQSEETTRRTYTAVRQPNGEWLFKW